MKPSALALVAVLVLPCWLGPAVSAAEDSAKTNVFVNHRVVPVSRRIALNQPLRLDFTTLPRQVDGVDVALVVANGISLAARDSWRIVGKPVVAEGDKTKTVTVTLTLLARATGDLPLPRFPMGWLSGDPLAEFGVVTVGSNIQIAGEVRPLPPECEGAGGVLWGAQLAEAKERFPGEIPKVEGERTLLKASSGLTLVFRGGELTDAQVTAPGLSLEQARTSFLERWGVPLSEDATGLTWAMGWTRITAVPGADGVAVTVSREDLQAKQAASKVKARVFSAFDAPGRP